MNRIYEGSTEIATLILANPKLPVYKMCGGSEDDDSYVLELKSAQLGNYWLYGGRVYDDIDGCAEAIYFDNERDMTEAEALDLANSVKTPSGKCIWLSMDYADFRERETTEGDGR